MIYLIILLIISIVISVNLYIKQIRYLRSMIKIYLKFTLIKQIVKIIDKNYLFYNDDTIDNLFKLLLLVLELTLLFLES